MGLKLTRGTYSQWIGVWTEYLTQGPSTTEYIKMHTATATEDGQRPGDVAILVPPVVATALANTVTKSMEACKLPIVKRRVRTGGMYSSSPISLIG